MNRQVTGCKGNPFAMNVQFTGKKVDPFAMDMEVTGYKVDTGKSFTLQSEKISSVCFSDEKIPLSHKHMQQFLVLTFFVLTKFVCESLLNGH